MADTVEVVLQGGPEDGRSVTLPDRVIRSISVQLWGGKQAHYRRYEDENGLAIYVFDRVYKVIDHA